MSCLFCLSAFNGPGCKSAEQAKKCGNFITDGHDPKWADKVEAEGPQALEDWEDLNRSNR